MQILWFDLETTGLDRETHTILEIAIVKTDMKGKILETWATKIKPTDADLVVASPKALEINGYSDEAWANAPTPEEVASVIRDQFRGKYVLGGHNIASFDVPFLKAWFNKHGQDPNIGYRFLDTMSTAVEHLFPCGLKSASLVNIRKALAIETGVAHTALADTLACAEAYNQMARSSVWKRLWWSYIIPKRMKQ